MRPEDFGARSGDPTFDSGPGLNAFFASCAANNVLDADISGDWYTDSQIVIGPASGTGATHAYSCGACTITAKSGFSGAVVSIQNSAYAHFIGYLFVKGYGGLHWAARTNSECVLVDTGCSYIRFDTVRCEYAQRDGFRHVSASDNGTVGSVIAQYCGTAPVPSDQLTATSSISSASNTGGVNSINQRTVLTLDAVPAALNTEDYALIDGHIHAVMSVDVGAKQVQVFPWTDPLTLPATVEWIIGCGLAERGSDANLWQFGQVSGVGCPCTVKTWALYPGSYGVCMAEASYANLIIGTPPNAASIGGSVDVLYSEAAVPFQVVVSTISTVDFSFRIGSSGTSADLTKWVCLGANAGTGQVDARVLVNGDIGGHGFGPAANPKNVLPTNLALQPVPSIVMAGIHNTKDVMLKATPGASEKFGINSMVIHALGTGASQQPTGTWTFTPETGFTVNGSASTAFSGFTKPAMFVCVLDQSAKNWIVYIAN